MSSIYISGQITGTDDYMERFAEAEKYLAEQEYRHIINPAKINANLPEYTPYRRYIDVSLELLRGCDCIYMLYGWENSKGARLEHVYAETVGLNIIYQDETRKKKYYWTLKGDFSNKYLNLNKDQYEIMLSNSSCENNCFFTRFTEPEYKRLAEAFNFSKDMFIKEEIE